ncbi:MAG: DUF433 domain-containing protein [Caldilineaceae bacterium]|nr:DUF433 domain-containing protein [Caldilineaceae bacterium]
METLLIESNPKMMMGKPVIKGTRLTVVLFHLVSSAFVSSMPKPRLL